MQELFTDDEIIDFCKALSSRIRLGMVRHIAEGKNTSLSELAEKLGISNAAITQNLSVLKKAGIVEVRTTENSASTKVCLLKEHKFVLELLRNRNYENMYETEIPIGQYTDYEVYPTCGIATPDALIGEVDDPRYFAFPARMGAGIIWSSKGYFEYLLPNLLKSEQRPIEIQISMELSSEAPGVAKKWPSDIYFFLNDVKLGYWTSPGDFGDVKGVYTPDWWFPNWNQYGLLKLLSINEEGTFLDGLKISDVTISSLEIDSKSEMRLKLLVPTDTENVGGITIFGSRFGNYNQDIRVRVFYNEEEK